MTLNRESTTDTIVAVATGSGGAISIVRVSGPGAIALCDAIFEPASGRSLHDAPGHTIHYGNIVDAGEEPSGDSGSEGGNGRGKGGENGRGNGHGNIRGNIHENICRNERAVGLQSPASHVVDDVLVSLFRAPRSYTGEDMVEISCHGSRYIQQRIVKLLLDRGARYARGGEFTLRSFLAGKLDLSQAEAVADMISATDKATHALASNQMRGGYSAEFGVLRAELVELASLLELELDFSDEQVEFADRGKLREVIGRIVAKIESLRSSFSLSNAIKKGVAVAIVGSPNAGKSTLLNSLLKEERAMVSEIPGTTRDSIEEAIVIQGVTFRFIDTAGIRHTDDRLEKMGIERTMRSAAEANVVLLIAEAAPSVKESVDNILRTLTEIPASQHERTLCVILNKADKFPYIYEPDSVRLVTDELNRKSMWGDSLVVIPVSAKYGRNTERIAEFLVGRIDGESIFNGETIISNSRHYEALSSASRSLGRALEGLDSAIPADLMAQDIREAIHHIGTVTGEITSDEILGSIFSRFCIGK